MTLTGCFILFALMQLWLGGIMDLSYISLRYKPPVLHTRSFPSRRAAVLLLVRPLSVWKGLCSSESVDAQQNIRWPTQGLSAFPTSYFYCGIKSSTIPTVKTKTLIKLEMWKKNYNSQLNQNNDIKSLSIFILSVKTLCKMCELFCSRISYYEREYNLFYT